MKRYYKIASIYIVIFLAYVILMTYNFIPMLRNIYLFTFMNLVWWIAMFIRLNVDFGGNKQ
jgi:hypothetical protein